MYLKNYKQQIQLPQILIYLKTSPSLIMSELITYFACSGQSCSKTRKKSLWSPQDSWAMNISVPKNDWFFVNNFLIPFRINMDTMWWLLSSLRFLGFQTERGRFWGIDDHIPPVENLEIVDSGNIYNTIWEKIQTISSHFNIDMWACFI